MKHDSALGLKEKAQFQLSSERLQQHMHKKYVLVCDESSCLNDPI